MAHMTRASSVFVAQDYFTGGACCHGVSGEVSASCILSLIRVHTIALRAALELYMLQLVFRRLSLPVFHKCDIVSSTYLTMILTPDAILKVVFKTSPLSLT